MISSAVVEAHHHGLWLKASVIVFDQREIQRQVALPGHSEHNLMRAIGTVAPPRRLDTRLVHQRGCGIQHRTGLALRDEQDQRQPLTRHAPVHAVVA